MTYKYNLGWSYMNYDKFSIEWYEDYNYKYMGAVNIYDGELQMNKYNL
jgi:hypothetical protein